ncbi:TagK domain-containing protein [Paraburkholderia caballeronis]|uniref:TagK domain-containing protein n=1 Tax=Paraburkholderia caballeronis TaxID=416943 RepID=UPI0010D27E45|nr:TagK domain-containing protein [Paraburkholderia caballeronis]TDV16438.1 hypothetical protein C7408_10557 [Paraburkholderia caballeronis]TDV18834.1 hypothetical protein C7406_104103 [Paraburkholderia caballeronis]TDV26967.1 hypothetical protein C7404_10557 [Paraburkholderia caballeronis]
MTGYHARWDNARIGRGRIRTLARTLLSVDGPRDEPPQAMHVPPHVPLARVSSSGAPLSATRRGNVFPLRAVQDSSHPRTSLAPESPAVVLPDVLSDAPSDISSDRAEDQTKDLTDNANAATTAAPNDFSDLIALAGPAALDERYHDYPASLHTTMGSQRGRPDGPSALLLDGHDGHDGGNTDPLAKLSAEYEQALLHPESVRRHAHADPHADLMNASAVERAPVATPPRDPFADADATPSGLSLIDLLVVGQNIDTVLDSLDPFGADRIFEDETRHEILALLAPLRSVAPRTTQTARLAREEHHLMSVDSHLDLPATEYDKPRPDHENLR